METEMSETKRIDVARNDVYLAARGMVVVANNPACWRRRDVIAALLDLATAVSVLALAEGDATDIKLSIISGCVDRIAGAIRSASADAGERELMRTP
jgi:hypothetical protein